MNLRAIRVVPIAALLALAGCKNQNSGRPQPSQTAKSEPQTLSLQQDDDPILHGLRLGVALDSQLPTCTTQMEGGDEVVVGPGLCYVEDTFVEGDDKGTWARMPIMRVGQSVAAQKDLPDLSVTLVPAKMKERGTVEQVFSAYGPERLGEIRSKLTAQYGSPIDPKGWPHWTTPWGCIDLEDWSKDPVHPSVQFTAETSHFRAMEKNEDKQTTPDWVGMEPKIVIKRCGVPLDDHRREFQDQGQTYYIRVMVYEGPLGLVGVNFSSPVAPGRVTLAGVKEANGPLQSVYKQEGRDNIKTILPCLSNGTW
jgi:hypothetical protein